MTDSLATLVARCRERMEVTDEPDPATQDLLIAVCQDLEMQHWMLQAQV